MRIVCTDVYYREFIQEYFCMFYIDKQKVFFTAYFMFRIICPVGYGRKVNLQEFVAHKASCIPSDEINKIFGNTLRSIIEQPGSNTGELKTSGQVILTSFRHIILLDSHNDVQEN